MDGSPLASIIGVLGALTALLGILGTGGYVAAWREARAQRAKREDERAMRDFESRQKIEADLAAVNARLFETMVAAGDAKADARVGEHERDELRARLMALESNVRGLLAENEDLRRVVHGSRSDYPGPVEITERPPPAESGPPPVKHKQYGESPAYRPPLPPKKPRGVP